MNPLRFENFEDIINRSKENIGKIKANYLDLLSNLSEVKEISNALFIGNLSSIFETGKIIVCYDGEVGEPDFRIVGTCTIFIESKIFRGGSPAAHIEDLVVDPLYESRGIASTLLQYMVEYAVLRDCYKVILDCEDKLVGFYEKKGFSKHGNQMKIYSIS